MSGPEMMGRLLDAGQRLAQRVGLLTARHVLPAKFQTAVDWVKPDFVANVDLYRVSANRVLMGPGHVFAVQLRGGLADRDWNADPLTGVRAPLLFGPSINLRSKRAVGDIKYLWEPNRHHEIVNLAQAYSLTGDQAYLEGVRDALSAWLEQCPYFRGPNWSSGLELAVRLINWSVAWQLVGGLRSPLFDGLGGKRLRDQWMTSVYQHVHFVKSNYSRHSSANNHLVGEAAGLFIATCTWPYWKSFAAWGAQAKGVLVRQAEAQTHTDGVNREQAIAYQQFVLDFFILAGLAGRAAGTEFLDNYWKTIERMMEFVFALMDQGGNVPMIGDADDGFVLRISQETGFCPYRSLLATGAMLFQRPDFAIKSGGLDDKTRFLLGNKGWTELQSMGHASGENRRRSFPAGGYYILGQNFNTRREIRLVADCGPLGYLSIAAHGHADALALYLSVAGREFLVDPGTYTYHGKPEWRAYFRGTRAHNTVTVDGEDQSVQGGSFMWLKHAQARCLQFEQGNEEDFFSGEHDGYRRLQDPVTHRRAVRRRGDVIDVTDTLVCKGDHSIERWWHFSELCNVELRDGELHAENQGVRIRCTPGNGKIRMFRASESPIAGWVSRRFDVKTPSTSVCIRTEIQGTTALHTRIECFPR